MIRQPIAQRLDDPLLPHNCVLALAQYVGDLRLAPTQPRLEQHQLVGQRCHLGGLEAHVDAMLLLLMAQRALQLHNVFALLARPPSQVADLLPRWRWLIGVVNGGQGGGCDCGGIGGVLCGIEECVSVWEGFVFTS